MITRSVPWAVAIAGGVIAFSLYLVQTSPAAAHAAVWGRLDAPTVALAFAYSDGESMSYAGVTVNGPGAGPEAQSGRTDRNGRFAFIPDRDGTWQVTADDGGGHVVTAHVEVSGGQAAGKASAALDPFQNSLIHQGWIVRTACGLSLLLNLGLGAIWWRRRRHG